MYRGFFPVTACSGYWLFVSTVSTVNTSSFDKTSLPSNDLTTFSSDHDILIDTCPRGSYPHQATGLQERGHKEILPCNFVDISLELSSMDRIIPARQQEMCNGKKKTKRKLIAKIIVVVVVKSIEEILVVFQICPPCTLRP